jgi:hypothetical protein
MRAPWIGILLVLLAIAVTTTADAKQPPCPGGRYLVSGPPLVGSLDGEPMDIVDMHGKMVGVASGCAPVKSRVRGNATKGTKIRSRWSSCFGITGKVILTGTITDACRTLTGTIVAKSAGVNAPFLASLSECGDGIWDPDAGEACDAGLGPCGDLCNACTCAGVTTTTTGSGTTEPSSTTVPGGSTTTTPTTQPGGSTTTTPTQPGGSTTTTPTTPTSSTTSGGGGSTTTTSTHASTTTLVFPTTTSTSLPGATTSSTMPALPTTTTTSTTLAGADLTGIGWMSPGLAPSGGKIAVEITVKNVGTATAAGGFYDYIMFSPDYAFGGDTALAVVQHVASVTAGGQYTTLITMVQLPVIAPGTYYLYLQTDGTNAVAETNENNNIGGFVAITIY